MRESGCTAENQQRLELVYKGPLDNGLNDGPGNNGLSRANRTTEEYREI